MRRYEDNINMGLKETGYEDVDWIHLAQDGDQLQALVNTVMNIRFSQKARENHYLVSRIQFCHCF